MREAGVVLGACLAALIFVSSARAAAPGDLDHGFGQLGKVVTPFSDWTDEARAVTVDGEGRFVAAGLAYTPAGFDFAVARYRPDGSLDPTFGGDGTVTTPIGPGCDDARAVAIDRADRIVVAGVTADEEGDWCPSGTHHFSLARYLPDGTLDRSFGQDGTVITPMGAASIIEAIAIDSRDRIVAVGESSASAPAGVGTLQYAVARYEASGALDQSFGAGGRVVTPAGVSGIPYDVTVDPGGRIVVVGASCVPDEEHGCSTEATVVRYLANGTFDRAFGGDGVVTTHLSFPEDYATSELRAVALDDIGRIVVAGAMHGTGERPDSRFALARYDDGGDLDPTFGDGGIARTLIGRRSGADDVAVDESGRIVAVGSAAGADEADFGMGVARYTSDGSLDPEFGDGGLVTTRFDEFATVESWCCSGSATANAAVLDRDARLVVAGVAWDGENTNFALARYHTRPFAPAVSIAARPEPVTHSGSAAFAFEAVGYPAAFECSVDGAGYEPCTSPQRYEGLPDGEHVFAVRSVDTDGVRGDPAEVVWTVATSQASPTEETEAPPDETAPPPADPTPSMPPSPPSSGPFGPDSTGSGMPKVGARPDVEPPTLRVSIARRQAITRVLRHGLRVRTRTTAICPCRARYTLTFRSRGGKTSTTKRTPRWTTNVRLSRSARRVLRRGGRLDGTLSVALTDRTGRALRRTYRVRIRGR